MVTFRQMTRDELDVVLSWATDEGWNPGLHDADAFYAADPGGFFVAQVDDEIIASISLVRFSSSYAFLGFYIVRVPYRGQGHGKALWDYALNRLRVKTPDINIGLDGVVAQQANYQLSGFNYNYGNQRFAGIAAPATAQQVALEVTPHVPRPLEPNDVQAVIDYDAACCGLRRERFLERWLLNEGHQSFVLNPQSSPTNANQKSSIVGFGVIRPCREGHKIGPLFADNRSAAHLLFQQLSSTVVRQTIFLDVPAPNEHALGLAEANHLQPVFETARMHTGPLPDLKLDQIFGVCTFELG